jgi:hypothetical protein
MHYTSKADANALDLSQSFALQEVKEVIPSFDELLRFQNALQGEDGSTRRNDLPIECQATTSQQQPALLTLLDSTHIMGTDCIVASNRPCIGQQAFAYVQSLRMYYAPSVLVA